jgi:hypothetical protein
MCSTTASATPRLDPVEARALVDAILDVDELQPALARVGVGAREGEELGVVEVDIGEGDQRFVLAAVVPAQPAPGDAGGHELLEHALHVVEQRLAVLAQRRLDLAALHGEEVGRRQLLRVADHDELVAADDRADRVLCRHLARLVEDDQVEVVVLRVEELRDRQRAHHEARLDRLDRAVRLVERATQRRVAAGAGELRPQEAHVPADVRREQPLLDPFAQTVDQRRAVLLQHAAVELLELGDALLVRQPVEAQQRRSARDHVVEPFLEESALERGGERVELDLAG